MVGKVPNLDPNLRRVRFKGAAYVYYDSKRATWIARSYPKGKPRKTPARVKARAAFSTIVQLIKQLDPTSIEFAEAMTKNSPWLTRDFLMSNAYGRAMIAEGIDGNWWVGVRIVSPEIQAALNSITDQVGAMLIRYPEGWRGFVPDGTVDGQILTIHGPGTTPTWEDAPPSGVQTVTPGTGIDASITGSDIAIALAQIATGKVLGNFHGANHTPDLYSVVELLQQLGNTEGELIYRDATGWTVLAAGGANEVLVSNGTSLSWLAVGSGGLATEPSLNRFIATPAHPGFDPGCVYNASVTLSNNNKDAQPASSSPYNYLYGLPAQFTGKRYLEFKPASTSFAAFGFAGGGSRIIDLDSGSPGNFGEAYHGQVGITNGGAVKAIPFHGVGGAVTISTVATWAANDDLCFAIDLDAALLWIRTNAGNWNNSGTANPSTGVGGIAVPMLFSGGANGLVFPGCNLGNTSKSTMRLLAADFARAIPSGFAAWSP
jgi:hypothetical protein